MQLAEDVLFSRRVSGAEVEVAPSAQRRRRPYTAMLKIQMKELDDGLILQVEGRLAGAFVPELENCWQAARTDQPNRKISVDLKDVICVDRAGRYLLQLMHSNGVGFLRAGLSIQDIVEEVLEQPECKH
jgi:anti-anti-sigma regulatory factor